MNFTDNITILLALYGALLSTILAIRELKREKKQIRMVLTDDWTLRVVNMGHRPTTIVKVEIWTQNESKFSSRGWWRGGGRWWHGSGNIDKNLKILPKTLSDGEQLTLKIPEKIIRPNKDYPLFTHVKFVATDAENREYEMYVDWEFDGKGGWSRRSGKKRL